MEEITQLSTDAFSRVTLVRRVIRSSYTCCAWCGGRTARGYVYNYGTETDWNRTSWDSRDFCSLACRKNYYR